jgi:hypothetical protein
MAAELTIKCGNVENGTGDIRAKIDAVHVSVTGLDVWNTDGTQKRYRYRVTPPAGLENDTVSGYSHLFAPSRLGEHQWDGYIFPGAGAWNVRIHDEEEDLSVVDEAVTVI